MIEVLQCFLSNFDKYVKAEVVTSRWSYCAHLRFSLTATTFCNPKKMCVFGLQYVGSEGSLGGHAESKGGRSQKIHEGSEPKWAKDDIWYSCTEQRDCEFTPPLVEYASKSFNVRSHTSYTLKYPQTAPTLSSSYIHLIGRSYWWYLW